jgi:hypothetical protein
LRARCPPRAARARAREMMTVGPLAELLPAPLRLTPLLLEQAAPADLCAARPPWGLLTEPNQIGGNAAWLSNFTRLRGVAKREAHTELCQKFAQRMVQSASDPTRKLLRGQLPALIRLGDSCAVVGSSGAIAHGGHGGAIDAHDTVFRMNAAPAGGRWAADAGTRTTVRIYTDKTYQKLGSMDGEDPWTAGSRSGSSKRSKRGGGGGGGGARRGHLTSHNVTAAVVYCMAAGWVGKCMHTPRLWHANPVFVSRLRDLLDARGGRGRLPSAGMLSVAMALLRCGSLDLYGFGNASEPRDEGVCSHYWECGRSQAKYFGGKAGYHEWGAQWRLLSGWLEQATVTTPGRVRFVTHAVGTPPERQEPRQEQAAAGAGEYGKGDELMGVRPQSPDGVGDAGGPPGVPRGRGLVRS